ncbi:MAG: hypothetical protein U1E50_07485 [Caulobacteraceae bacterium]
MKRTIAAIAGLLTLAAPLIALAALPMMGSFKVLQTIPAAGEGWDHASFDPELKRLYVSHGAAVLTLDTKTGAVNPAFAAGNRVHAVITIPTTGEVMTTNGGDNTVRFFAADTGRQIASLPAGRNPDAAIYDPATRLVLVTDNGAKGMTLIDPVTHRLIGTMDLGGKPESVAIDGVGRAFINLEDRNEVAVVDIARRAVLASYPLAGCQGPTGIAKVNHGWLVVACGNGVVKVLAGTGQELASYPVGRFPDAVIYDAKHKLAFVPSAVGGQMIVINVGLGTQPSLAETVATAPGARTGAVDEKTGRVYLPTADYNPAVGNALPTVKPGTFHILVVGK